MSRLDMGLLRADGDTFEGPSSACQDADTGSSGVRCVHLVEGVIAGTATPPLDEEDVGLDDADI